MCLGPGPATSLQVDGAPSLASWKLKNPCVNQLCEPRPRGFALVHFFTGFQALALGPPAALNGLRALN